MPNTPRLFREVTLRSAVKVMRDAGLTVTGAEITPEGVVRVLTTPINLAPVEEPNPFDRVIRRGRD
jgi:hypothetical protein